MWPNFDGKPYTRAELAAHINACDFSRWKRKDGTIGRPTFITLHNTSSPDIRLWMSWSPQKRQQYIRNMQPYYEGKGWRAGPHFFVPPQDDICAFGFSDLMAAGTHASCFNDHSIGIEMVGEFDNERFDTGPGAQVADNAIYLMALLHNKIGITPLPYAYNQHGLHFHVECQHDNHHCPGSFVRKPDVVARVQAKMAELAAPVVAAAPRWRSPRWRRLRWRPLRRRNRKSCCRPRRSNVFARLRLHRISPTTTGSTAAGHRSVTLKEWRSSSASRTRSGKQATPS